MIGTFYKMNAIVPPILSLHGSSERCPRGPSQLRVDHLHDTLLAPVSFLLCERKYPDAFEDVKHPDVHENVKHPDVDSPAKTRPGAYSPRGSPHSL